MKLAAKIGKKTKEEACKKQKTGRSSSRKRTGAAIDEVRFIGSKLSSCIPCAVSVLTFAQRNQEMTTGEKKSDDDDVDEELARVTANLATKRKPLNDESQRTISALLEQSRRTQLGLMQQASESEAARGDVSACGEETQAEEDVREMNPAHGLVRHKSCCD